MYVYTYWLLYNNILEYAERKNYGKTTIMLSIIDLLCVTRF